MNKQFTRTLFKSTGGYAALALRIPVDLVLAGSAAFFWRTGAGSGLVDASGGTGHGNLEGNG